jgi:hypothetical protein
MKTSALVFALASAALLIHKSHAATAPAISPCYHLTACGLHGVNGKCDQSSSVSATTRQTLFRPFFSFIAVSAVLPPRTINNVTINFSACQCKNGTRLAVSSDGKLVFVLNAPPPPSPPPSPPSPPPPSSSQANSSPAGLQSSPQTSQPASQPSSTAKAGTPPPSPSSGTPVSRAGVYGTVSDLQNTSQYSQSIQQYLCWELFDELKSMHEIHW